MLSPQTKRPVTRRAMGPLDVLVQTCQRAQPSLVTRTNEVARVLAPNAQASPPKDNWVAVAGVEVVLELSIGPQTQERIPKMIEGRQVTCCSRPRGIHRSSARFHSSLSCHTRCRLSRSSSSCQRRIKRHHSQQTLIVLKIKTFNHRCRKERRVVAMP